MRADEWLARFKVALALRVGSELNPSLLPSVENMCLCLKIDFVTFLSVFLFLVKFNTNRFHVIIDKC